MPGAQCTRSLVCESGVVECTRVFTASSPDQPGIPARNGFNGFLRALLGDRLVDTVAFAETGAANPVGLATPPLDLTPAPGRQDHTTSPSAAAPFVCAPVDRSRAEARPAIPLRADAAASTASLPASMTMANAPLWGGTAAVLKVIWGEREAEYFSEPHWTGQIRLIRLDNFAVARKPEISPVRVENGPAHLIYWSL
jgi:hypothetical protein